MSQKVLEQKTDCIFGDVSQATVRQVVDTFLRLELASLSTETVRWYKQRLYGLSKYLGDERSLMTVLGVDLLQWYADLAGKEICYGVSRPEVEMKLSPDTLRGHVRAAKRFCKWTQSSRILGDDLGRDLRLPKIPKRGKKGISEGNLRAIIEASRSNPRDYALIRFIESTGCRRAGAAGLLLSDLSLDVDNPRLRRRALVREKGDKERVVLLTPNSLKALIAWLEVRPVVVYENVFLGKRQGGEWCPISPDGVSQVFKRYKKKLGLTGECSPHQWRHRFCRKRLQEGLDLSRVSQLAGHEDPQITIRFYGGFAIDDLQDGYDSVVEDIE